MIRVHWCLLDRMCRSVEAPPRVYLFIARHHWWLNLTDWRDRGHHVRRYTGRPGKGE